ncbi:MAG: hypothetical protein OZSIB_2735 [Candidatus Ozemobacter sibiricus]|uniref:Uncharacterized protein n=1 Tax=Candidatus Ozemobacter sibiricus TaxID=2268124 RepID=A0A367ZSN1_9BACT|nr:MAG: hypothetical protein OZSIB_2735 [Candidatus Ozemobacter sibiricus]
MRLNRTLTRSLATTLAVVMMLAAFTHSAHAGLFSNLVNKAKQNPVKTALATVAVGAGAIIAGPYIASALGFASGATVAAGAGAATAIGGLGAGIAGIGSAIWGGLVAAGGFVTGALGAVGAAIGSMFSGIAGFIGGIIGSPLFIPALVVIGAAVVGYLLWKNYKRQKQTISNGSNLPSAAPSVTIPSGEIVVSGDVGKPTGPAPVAAPANEIPVSANTTPASTQVAPEVVPAAASDALKAAHARYIKAYNRYINIVTNIGGSENPDEELRTNMLRSDTQAALNEYRNAYNEYITLLRQSNSK